MKILMTGSTGILGRRFIEKFTEHQYLIYKGRVENYFEVSKFINENKEFDVVLHLAALVPRNIVENQAKEAFYSNVVGTFNILESFRQIKLENAKIIVASTSHVYQSKADRIKEEDQKDPISWYGKTKLFSENICETFSDSYKINICIPRIFSYTDFLQSQHFFVPAMIKKIYTAPLNEKLFIPGLNGARDFLTSEQVVTSLEYLCRKPINSPINIGSGAKIILLDLVQQIINKLKRNDLIITTDNSVLNLVSDNSKLKNIGVDLENNISRYLNVMIDNYISTK